MSVKEGGITELRFTEVGITVELNSIEAGIAAELGFCEVSRFSLFIFSVE
ncbi:MAG: hypothetical protein MUO26_12045 [Methanotrichaceae archaeon]|nr:hypothetical protein [Methanotrichaceae archaeon]